MKKLFLLSAALLGSSVFAMDVVPRGEGTSFIFTAKQADFEIAESLKDLGGLNDEYWMNAGEVGIKGCFHTQTIDLETLGKVQRVSTSVTLKTRVYLRDKFENGRFVRLRLTYILKDGTKYQVKSSLMIKELQEPIFNSGKRWLANSDDWEVFRFPELKIRDEMKSIRAEVCDVRPDQFIQIAEIKLDATR